MDNVKKPRPKYGQLWLDPKRKYPPCRALSAGDFTEREIRAMERQYGCPVARPG